MAYIEFKDMDSEEQIMMLHKAVKELQQHFKGHNHTSPGGRGAVELDYLELADVDGHFDEPC